MSGGGERSGGEGNGVTGNDALAQEFELHRPRLRAVAYRMLGSLTEADDVLQETWLRFSAAGTGGVENVGSWLTTAHPAHAASRRGAAATPADRCRRCGRP
jgi:DNA-directed RNA polymerase specialized sigma24 family protein